MEEILKEMGIWFTSSCKTDRTAELTRLCAYKGDVTWRFCTPSKSSLKFLSYSLQLQYFKNFDWP